MKTGDAVEVTNPDGETAEGEILVIHPGPASEWRPDFIAEHDDYTNDASLWDYWQRKTDPDAPVIQVALSGGVYDYPADRVRVLEDADG